MQRGKDAKKQITAIKRSCCNFFIEVVSSLCFGQATAPEDELIEMLLNIVFTEQAEKRGGEDGEGARQGTRDLTPYKQKSDDKPIIRSFLLQLLLEHKYVSHVMTQDRTFLISSPFVYMCMHSSEVVKGHLKTYFNRCQQALVGGVGVDHELCLLCTQCFEVQLIHSLYNINSKATVHPSDHLHTPVYNLTCIYFSQDALHKEHSNLALVQKMESILRKQLLSSAAATLSHFAVSSQRSITVEVLEAVAKMRYALMVVAELLQLQVNVQGEAHNLYGRAASAVVEEARCILCCCTITNIPHPRTLLTGVPAQSPV